MSRNGRWARDREWGGAETENYIMQAKEKKTLDIYIFIFNFKRFMFDARIGLYRICVFLRL